MFTHKVDEEISLKLVTHRDAEEIFDLIERNREHLRKWLGWLDVSTEIETTYQFIDANLRRFVVDEALDTAILYGGKIVGKISLHTVNRSNQSAQIGYMLDEGYGGKGIMTRAAKTMTDIGMFEYDLHKIEIRAAVDNKKSRAIPERLGYKKEGRIRSAEWLYNQYVDHVVYGMLRSEWLARK